MQALNKHYVLIIAILLCNTGLSQVTRYSDINHVFWNGNHFTFKMNNKLDIVGDFQIRRDNGIKDPLLNQVRAGVQYNFTPKLSTTVGYSFIEQYPFGDPQYPISPSGYKYPENRLYAQLVLKDKMGRVEITHRYRYELRWVARQDKEHMHEILEWRRSNRFRYFMKMQTPLQGPTLENKEFYFVFQNELLINFGSKVKYNVFDQFRSAPLLGYKFGPKFKIEAGGILQILQLGSYPNKDVGKSVFQYNFGFNVNTYFNFDFSKEKADMSSPVK